MNIQSAKYIVSPFSGNTEVVQVILTDSNVIMSVPIDPSNSDYAEIMRQVEAGELVIQEADT